MYYPRLQNLPWIKMRGRCRQPIVIIVVSLSFGMVEQGWKKLLLLRMDGKGTFLVEKACMQHVLLCTLTR